MEKSILRFPVLPPSKSQQIFCALTVWAAAALPEARSHYDLGAESWGNFNSAVSGRAAGRHVPAWVSVGPCTPPRFSCRRPGVRCRRGCQAECSTRGRRWEISCASAECDFFFIFFARKPQVFGLQTFHRARLQRDHAKHAERPFAHPSYRIRPIISTIASYDFFIYKYYINNV